MEYALLDWDNTLRKGFTLFSWIDYLIDNEIIGNVVRKEIDFYINEYKKKRISHDQLAMVACEIFSMAIKGMDRLELKQQIQNYLYKDDMDLFTFTSEIFDILNAYKIRPIIISGAPKAILEEYQIKFNIYKIYAFVAEEKDGKFTGKVLYNYGYNKGLKVEEICKEIGKVPRIAFGDSISDFEMLNKAEKSVIVCKEEKDSEFYADGKIETNMTAQEVKKLLIKILD